MSLNECGNGLLILSTSQSRLELMRLMGVTTKLGQSYQKLADMTGYLLL